MLKPGQSFICACGRQQTYQPRSKPGGVTWDEAQAFGWSGTPTAATCPICNRRAARRERLNERMTAPAQELLDRVKALPLKDRAVFAEAYEELESEWCPYCYADMPEGSGKHPCFEGAEQRVSNAIGSVIGEMKARSAKH
jgi:hypothetical protein